MPVILQKGQEVCAKSLSHSLRVTDLCNHRLNCDSVSFLCQYQTVIMSHFYRVMKHASKCFNDQLDF